MAFGLEGQKKKKTPPPKPDGVQNSDEKANSVNDNEPARLQRPEHMSDEQWEAWRQRDLEVSNTFLLFSRLLSGLSGRCDSKCPIIFVETNSLTKPWLQYVSGTFESDMEAALMQSKLDYQKEQARLQHESQSKAKPKKKPVAVPLGEFHAMLNNVSIRSLVWNPCVL